MSRKDPPFNVKNSARSNTKRFGDGSPLRTSLAMSSYQERENQMPKYDQEGNAMAYQYHRESYTSTNDQVRQSIKIEAK